MRRHSLGDHEEFGQRLSELRSKLGAGTLRAHGSRFILTIWASRGMTLTTTDMMKDANKKGGAWTAKLREIFPKTSEKPQVPISAGAEEADK